MYRGYNFIFAEESSDCYGLFVCDIGSKRHSDNSFGNKANIVETRLPHRITPLHYGVRYHDDPLAFPIIFASEQYMDRYQLQEISNWLTGYQDYQWLCIEQPDMEHIQFRCLIQELTPISVGWYPVAFEARVICDCAYGYSFPFTKQLVSTGSLQTVVYNDSTIRENLKPDLTIQLASGVRNLSITNRTTGATMSFTGLPAGGITILVDNENGIVRDSRDEYDMYEYFNFQFFDLASGDNDLLIVGACTVAINGRYLYNVGA